MLMNQQEAEKKKVQSQEIQSQIEKQTVVIAEKQKVVSADLERVEPAVIEAQQGRNLLIQVSYPPNLFPISLLVFFIRSVCFRGHLSTLHLLVKIRYTRDWLI